MTTCSGGVDAQKIDFLQTHRRFVSRNRTSETHQSRRHPYGRRTPTCVRSRRHASRYHGPWPFSVTNAVTFTFLSAPSAPSACVRVCARVVVDSFLETARNTTRHFFHASLFDTFPRERFVGRSSVGRAAHRTEPRTERGRSTRSFVRSFDDRRSRG